MGRQCLIQEVGRDTAALGFLGSPVSALGRSRPAAGSKVDFPKAQETVNALILVQPFQEGAFPTPGGLEQARPEYSSAVTLRKGETQVHTPWASPLCLCAV